MSAAILPRVPSGSVRLRHVAIVDVGKRGVLHDGVIAIENGIITSVGSDPGGPIASGDHDAAGLYALPGLIDAHVHVIASTADEWALTGLPMSYAAAAAAQELRATLRRGFTTVRDAGGADDGLGRALAEGLIDGPRLMYCGHALSPSGGHGDLRPRGRRAREDQWLAPGIGFVVDGVDRVREAVREEIRAGAGFIKLMLSGGVSSPTDAIDELQFSDEEITAAVDEARRHGLGVAGHAYTSASVRRAVQLGVRTIEHGNLIDTAAAAAMAESGTVYVPTLSTYEVLVEQAGAGDLPPGSLEKITTVYDGARSAVRIAAARGVPIAFGTDLLGSMRSRQLDEFRLRASIQDTWDVLDGATRIGARALGLPGSIGELAEGAVGDVVLCRVDPTADPAVLADRETITEVFLAGRKVDG